MSSAQQMIDAVKAGDASSVVALLASDARLAEARAANGDSAVLLACYHGHADIIALLLAAEPALSIHEAAALGQDKRVTMLLRDRPSLANDVAHDGWTPLHLASFFGHAAAAEALMASGADVHAWSRNDQRNQPLHAAVAGNHHALASLLIIAGADVNARAAHGFTPIHSSAQNGNDEVTRALLDAGADPGVAADDGRTPLALAPEGSAVANLLRRAGGR